MKRRIDAAVKSLESNPYTGKPLRGELFGKMSLRIGDYRIIYTIDESRKTVTLYSIGHRRAVYR